MIHTSCPSVARDITDLKRDRDRLKQLSLVAEQTTNIVVIMNTDFGIEWVNKAFETTFGYQLEEVIGANPADFLVGEKTDTSMVEIETAKLLKNQEAHLELINYDKNGNERWIEMTINPVLDNENRRMQCFS